MRKRQQTHSVKSDRYISLMVTSNTAGVGRAFRIRKALIPFLFLLLAGIIAVIALFYIRFEELTVNYADVSARLAALEVEKASSEKLLSEEFSTKEKLLSTELSEKEELISDLLTSLEEKEEQLNNIELQAEAMWTKIEELEAIKNSIYDKLNDAPADIYETDDEDEDDLSAHADITPYNITVSMSGYSGDKSASLTTVTDITSSADNFSTLYEELLAKFSALESSIRENYSVLNELSDMTDAYLPYVEAVPSGYPIKDSHITCEYGPRIDPVTGKKNAYHYGLDFSAAYRQSIYSTAPGTVIFSGYSTDFGYNIIIDHGYGYTTRYAHLSKLYVKKGATVKRGDLIGGAGSTGKSTAVHLHYEVRLNGERINPADFLE